MTVCPSVLLGVLQPILITFQNLIESVEGLFNICIIFSNMYYVCIVNGLTINNLRAVSDSFSSFNLSEIFGPDR